ncbi:MAG: ATP-binding protein [Chromatiales bacterium]|jgi:hypothetical protein
MAMLHSDVVVHIDEDLDDGRIYDIERQLGTEEGIYSACVNDRARHLLLIDYDPTGIRSSDILDRVRRNGLHAALIGM